MITRFVNEPGINHKITKCETRNVFQIVSYCERGKCLIWAKGQTISDVEIERALGRIREAGKTANGKAIDV